MRKDSNVKNTDFILFVSPLIGLMKDQISRLSHLGITATALRQDEGEDVDVDVDVSK